MDKKCTKCGEVKSVEEFYGDKKSKDGHHSQCIKCFNKSRKKHYLDNRDKMLKRAKDNRIKFKDYYKEYSYQYNKSHKKEKLEHSQNWAKNNPEKVKESHQRHYLNNKEKINEKSKQRNKDNPEKRKEVIHNYYLRNKEEVKKRSKEWAEKNPERYKETKKIWCEKNKDRCLEYVRRKQCLMRKHRPPWADKEMIKAIYSGARIATMLFERDFQVDHIVPLNHKYISGLHVPDNLQILTAEENLIKSNRFIVEGRN